MLDVLIWTGISLWGVATLAAWVFVMWALITGLGDDEPQRIVPAIGVLVLAVLSSVLLVMTANGILGPGLPPDGCYRLTHTTFYTPMNTGNNTTVPVPVDNVFFIPIACPN